MRLEGIDVVLVQLALRDNVRSAGVNHGDKPTIFLRVAAEGRYGWGECVAYPDAREPDPTVDAVEPAVVDRSVRRFVAAGKGEVPPASAVFDACAAGRSVAEQTVAAALEMAVLDLELIAASQSVASWLSVTRRAVETGSVVGIPERRDLSRLTDAVGKALEGGARRVRVKIEPGWDHAPLRELRERFPDAVLMADANCSYDGHGVEELAALDDYALSCLEQPFGPDDLAAHRALGETMATPIGLDESLSSLPRIESALAAGACQVACLKPGRLGGAVAARAAASACASAGVGCFVGGFFESGLARSLNAALAGRAEFGLPGDLGDPDLYLEGNPFGYLEAERGMVRISDAPGLGAGLRPEVLARQTVHRRWIPASR